jgi:hypothetical protein
MRTLFLVILFVGLYTSLCAQLQLTLNPLPLQTLREADLSQFTLTNAGPSAIPTVLKLSVRNAQKEEVYFWRSAVMRIAPGMSRIGRENLQLSDLAFLSDSVRKTVARCGQFPTNTYTICIEAVDQQSRLEIGRFCIEHNVVLSEANNAPATKKAAWKEHVNFYGFGNIESQYATRQGTNQQVPATYTRMDVRPGLELGPLPLEMNFFYSTEEDRSRQQQYILNFRFNEQRFKGNLTALVAERIRKRQAAKMKEFAEQRKKLAELEKYSKALEDPELLKDVEGYRKLEQMQEQLKAYNVNSFDELAQKLRDEGASRLPADQLANAQKLLEDHGNLKNTFANIESLVGRNAMYRRLSERVTALQDYRNKLNTEGILERMNQIESFDFSKLSNPNELKSQHKELGLFKGSNRTFYNIRGLAVGNIFPYHSFLTLDGLQLFGGSAELNLGPAYISVASGKALRQVTSPGIPFSPYNQNILAAKTGLGKVEGSHFYLGFVRGIDNAFTDTLSNRPKDNLVIAPDLQLSLFKGNVVLKAEGAVSQYTRDQFAEQLEIAGYTNVLERFDFLPKPNLSTFADWSYSVSADINLFKQATVLHVGQVYIGPGYQSIGTPFLRNDLLRQELRINHRMLKNRIQLTGFFRNDRDNNFNFKGITTVSKQLGAGADFLFPKFPYIRMRYTPVFQQNGLGELTLHLGSIQSGYNYKIKGLQASTNFSFMNGFSEALVLNNYNSRNLNLSQSITLAIPLQLTLSYTSSTIVSADVTQNINGAEMSGSFTLFKRLSNTLALNYYNRNDRGANLGFWYDFSGTFLKIFQGGLRIEYNTLNDLLLPVNNFNEVIVRARIGFNF